MKKLMMTAASAAILAVGAGAAQATDQNINLNATVTGFCTIGGSLTPTTINQSIPTTTTGDVVTTPINVALGAVVCNKASDVTLSSLKGGVFSATSAPSGFQNRINYTASVSAPTAASVNANATAVTPTAGATASTGGATSDPAVNVTITPTLNVDPLVAATDYSDTLTVSIVPQA